MFFNMNPEFLDPQQNKLQIPLISPAASTGTPIGGLNTDRYRSTTLLT